VSKFFLEEVELMGYLKGGKTIKNKFQDLYQEKTHETKY